MQCWILHNKSVRENTCFGTLSHILDMPFSRSWLPGSLQWEQQMTLSYISDNRGYWAKALCVLNVSICFLLFFTSSFQKKDHIIIKWQSQDSHTGWLVPELEFRWWHTLCLLGLVTWYGLGTLPFGKPSPPRLYKKPETYFSEIDHPLLLTPTNTIPSHLLYPNPEVFASFFKLLELHF